MGFELTTLVVIYIALIAYNVGSFISNYYMITTTSKSKNNGSPSNFKTNDLVGRKPKSAKVT